MSMNNYYHKWNRSQLKEFLATGQYSIDPEIEPLTKQQVIDAIQQVIYNNRNLSVSGISRNYDGSYENELNESLEIYAPKKADQASLEAFKSSYKKLSNLLSHKDENSFNRTMLEYISGYSHKPRSLMVLGPSGIKKQLDNIKQLEILFNEFADNLENSKFCKNIYSTLLFTGHSVPTVRDPSKFRADKLGDASSVEEISMKTGRSLMIILRKLKIGFENQDFRYGDSISDLFNYLVRQKWSESRENEYHAFINVIPDLIESSIRSASSLSSSPFDLGEKINDELGWSSGSRASHNFVQDIKKYMSLTLMREGEHKNIFIKMKERLIKIFAPTKEKYESANKFLLSLASRKNEGEQTIYRGMKIDDDVMANLNKLYLEGNSGLVFDFYELSSWSINKETPMHFAFANKLGHEIPVIFVVEKPVRGTYIGDYSQYMSEMEFLTGGKVKITKIRIEEDRTNGPVTYIECEQI